MTDPGAYCREIEAHLCRSNGGHLIRIVGPAFELVCGWIDSGVPLQVAVGGIDRKLARYHGSGRKGRPLRIEYCEADVLQAFKEWRSAVGVSGETNGVVSASSDYAVDRSDHRRISLPKHIDRVLAYTTNRLALTESGAGLQAALVDLIDKLEILRRNASSARGKAREVLLNRLVELDKELLSDVRAAGASVMANLEDQARAELKPFKARLDKGSYATAFAACTDRLLRDHFRLPVVQLDD